jgi:hypothetical protein
MTQGIYCLYFDTDDGRYYVGKSSSGIEGRYVRHKSNLAGNRHVNYLLQKEYNRLGVPPNLYILEECLDPNLIDSREIFWIQKLDAYTSGFNLTVGGEGSAPGEKHPAAIYSEETYVAILTGLAEPNSSIINVSKNLGVSYDVVTCIATGHSHLYLQDKFPGLYQKMISQIGTRRVGGRLVQPAEVYENIFRELATTAAPMQDIADKYSVTLSVVADINKGQSHKYLHAKFPELFERIKANRGKLIRTRNIWPAVRSPTGEVYDVINSAEFARIHGLDTGGFSRLLNGHQKSTKGWVLA